MKHAARRFPNGACPACARYVREYLEDMTARPHAGLTTADGIYEWMAEGPRTS